MKKSFAFILAGFVFPAILSAQANTNLFPLMAWDYADSAKTLEAMRDCGITSVAFVRPNMLDACEKFGLKAIVFDESVAGTNWSKPFNGDAAVHHLAALVKKVGNHPAVYGYHLKDEPNEGEFPELGKAVAAVKKLAPGKWPYINLLPGGGEAYDKMLENFVATCSPTALSYDRYVLTGETNFDAGFWVNLAQVRAAALQHKLPFWNIVLTSPHWQYRDVTETDLQMQIWGSLVYGVNGIAYYKFVSRELPILDAPDLGNFHHGPLDQFGEKTQTWNWLRNCNRQVHQMAPTLMKLHSDDVYHIGNVPARNHGPNEKTLVKNIPGGEFVIGDFTHEDGTRYVMIVNKNQKNPVPCNPAYQSAPKSVNYVSPITGEIKPYTYPGYYFLAPGQGVLLQLRYE